VVNYVSESSRQRAEKIVEQIQQEIGTKAILCQASVMNLEEIPRLIEAALAISRDGKIDILIHKYVELPCPPPPPFNKSEIGTGTDTNGEIAPPSAKNPTSRTSS
jgi:hypothetical protein